jgi:hypothetical protein
MPFYKLRVNNLIYHVRICTNKQHVSDGHAYLEGGR